MRRLLTYTTVIAWAMLQLPLVFFNCCNDEATYAVLMTERECHCEHATDHHSHSHGHTHTHCHCGCSEHVHDGGSHSHDEDEHDSEHVIVQLPNIMVGADVELPQHVLTVDLPCDSSIVLRTAAEQRVQGFCWSGDPPPSADPVTTSDRLLV